MGQDRNTITRLLQAYRHGISKLSSVFGGICFVITPVLLYCVLKLPPKTHQVENLALGLFIVFQIVALIYKPQIHRWLESLNNDETNH